ncbi:hypothetical protein HYALB_00008949 [Hymenoscyphus albidus]|uniref:Major facilitator superfamily (MFS) profile domain-containing protein n=1 Tax=Hymenoscyphus albidus TaxID=595503 RepID=A0A9N9LH60_9HELO|nr:hypothetical protein HYALB_00008949 [Hymenoscyphus albidus]
MSTKSGISEPGSTPRVSPMSTEVDMREKIPVQSHSSASDDGRDLKTKRSVTFMPELESNEVKTTDPRTPLLRHKIIMFALCATVFAVSLDTFIMTNTLPTIAKDFDISDAGFAWIGSAYMLGFGVVVPFWANISTVFGRRVILIITSAIFFIGTVIGALSKNIAILLGGRAVQGIGGGGLVVLANICVGDLFSVRELGLYFGVVGAVTAVASASGHTIRGVLSEKASWRCCFWILVPFNVMSFVVLVFFLKLDSPKIPILEGLKRVDWLGSITIVGATLMLLIGLQMGGTSAPWNSLLVILLSTFGALGFVFFVVVEWKIAKPPLMPLKFSNRISTISTLGVNISQSFITTGCTYFLPLYFQIVLNVSPIMSGVYFLPTTAVLALFFIFVGYVFRRTGKYKLLIQVGAAALFLSTGQFIHLQPHADWPLIILTEVLIAIGLGLTYQAPLIAFHAQIDEADVAAGTSAFQFIKTLSQTMSVIFGQVIFQSQIRRQADILQVSGLPASYISSLSSGNAISTAAISSRINHEQQKAVRTVMTTAFNDMWIFYAVVAFLGFVASFGIRKVKL